MADAISAQNSSTLQFTEISMQNLDFVDVVTELWA